jgi:hypothetical protein
MALTTTTLSAAIGLTDTTMTVASATGFAVGSLARIDTEVVKVSGGYVAGTTTVPILRGQDGTVTATHPITANVIVGTAADSALPAAGADDSVTYPARPARPLASYTAAGAIALPAAGQDAVAVINGTAALAMTVAVPTKDMDGSILYIINGGKAAHTVTVNGTAGLGNGGSGLDVGTFAAGGLQCVALIACNGFWILLPTVPAGTLTNITVTWA